MMPADARRIELQADGLTFTAWEMGEGPAVLCLHGFPDTVETWRFMLPALADAGYRAIAVSLRGYEPQSCPGLPVRTEDFRLALLASDVGRWLDALALPSAHLVTHDWGATIGFAAARLMPDRITSLTAMSVPHPARFGAAMMADKRQLKASSYIVFFQLAGLAEFWVRSFNFAALDRLWRRWSPGWDGASAEIVRVKAALSLRGVLPAALSYYRAAANAKDAESLGLISGEIPVPVLGMFGARDGCILPDVFRACMREEDFPSGLQLHESRQAGHFLHLEQPEDTAGRVIEFLKSHS